VSETESKTSETPESQEQTALSTTVVDAAPAGAPAAGETPTEAEQDEDEKPVPYELLSSEMKPQSILALRFKVEPEQYKAKTERLYADLQKETILDGFRRGKAPLGLIRARFRRAVQEDAIDFLGRKVVSQYLEDKKPDILADPRIAEIKDFKEDEPLIIEASMEVRPRLEKIEYGDLSVEIEGREVTDGDVAHALEELRDSHASYVTESGAVVAADSGLVLDITVRDDRGRENEQASQKDFRVVNFEQHLPKPVCEALMGRKAGDVVEADVENLRKNKAGAVLSEKDHWTVTIKEVQRKELPALNDELAKDASECQTLEELKTKIRQQLEEAEQNRRNSEVFAKVCETLLERNPFDIPSTLLAASYQQIMREEMYYSMMSGDDPRRWSSDRQLSVFRRQMDDANSVTRHYVLLDEIARLENLEVSDADLDKEIERQAEQQGRRPLALRAQLEKQKRLDSLRSDLKLRKTREFLIAKAAVTIKPAEKKA